jgi:hypothetical protein
VGAGSIRSLSVKAVTRWAIAAAAVLAAGSAAPAADMAQSPRHRYAARHHRVEQVVVAPPSEYYERPLYQGPAFFYRPYYGSGPALQWFDFGLGRDKNGYP